MITKILKIALIIQFFSISLYSSSAGDGAASETRYIVDMPTGGTLAEKHFGISIRSFTKDGIDMQFETAVFENFALGVALSGTDVLGAEEPVLQEYPGVMISYRFLNETLSRPAMKIGLNTQGYGIYDEDNERFETYSPGLYIAVSKNYLWALGNFALHGGINYSIEPNAGDRMINTYFGFEQSAGDFAALNLEYNLTLADNPAMHESGLLNLALRFSLTNQIAIELIGRDLLNHLKATKGFRRALRFEIITSF